jgi:asparagine synthase (glutamine-hydrolysing)
MCGITGYWNLSADEHVESMRARITPMTNVMFARGPDSGGIWVSPGTGLALGHRRLAIRDLSPTGHQPMSTENGRFVIVYNGEIYDAAPLRDELQSQGVRFRGTSDTEILLYGCAMLGVEATISRLSGMFAFALWDKQEGKLTLARDRLGIKPLYWGKFNQLFLFGSDLRALALHGGWAKEVNRDAVAALMDVCCIPAPLSIYRGIYKLLPGHLLEINRDGAIKQHCWWDTTTEFLRNRANPCKVGDVEATDELEQLLRQAVRGRMVADVPLGAFLSGGVDSSLVAALMQAQSDRPVHTFSIGFEQQEYNEAPFAKAVARHLGTHHTEEIMTAQQAIDAVPSISEWYDEPFADSSQLPTYLLSWISRKHVITALSGDGGDELFGGYSRYFQFLAQYNKQHRPVWQQKILSFLGNNFAANTLYNCVRLLPSTMRPYIFGARVTAFAQRQADESDPVAFYHRYCLAHWTDPEALVPGAKLPDRRPGGRDIAPMIQDHLARMRLHDTVRYLPDDILVKVDRASMAVSLEARVPLLDHRVCSFAWSLPDSFITRDGQGKWLLREVLYRYVPRELIDRPKMGFGAPIDYWLRGPLREWCEALLSPERLRQEGYLNPDIITPIWQRHLKGEGWHYWLWDVLMFQSWLEQSKREPVILDARLEVEVVA